MKKAIYLIQERGCLNPLSGAFQHISVGHNELAKEFVILTFLNNKRIDLKLFEDKRNDLEFSIVKNNNPITKGFIYGSVKDLYIILSAICNIPRLCKLYKKENPSFIYERTSYLNPSGLIAAMILSIPHFYEANGLQFERMEKYFKSFLKPVNRYLERWTYKNSNHVFFVGSYGNYWQLKSNNWTNVENGIEKEFVTMDILPKISDGVTHLVFVGSLMQHHRPDILKEALLLLKPEEFHIHLVGSKLDNLYNDLLNNNIPVTHHGFIHRKKLNALISEFHIGIIAGSPEFNSNMKLFDYALAKCSVVAPNVDVLKLSFKNELMFFDGTSVDLANKLIILMKDYSLRNILSLKLYDKVKSQFNWDVIFRCKSEIIKSKIAE